MLLSIRSREKWRCAGRSHTYYIYWHIAIDHLLDHWTRGPPCSSYAASPRWGPFPAAPAGGVRGNADGPCTIIDPSIRFSSIQSNPIQGAQAHHHSTALHVLPSALPADPAFRLLLTWANQQYALPCRHFHMEFGATSIRRDEPFTPTGPNQDKRIRYVKSKSRIGTQNY
jgi:hypothetical protein